MGQILAGISGGNHSTFAATGAATNGGTNKLAGRVKAVRDIVQSAIVAMQSGLESDFTAKLADLSTLLNGVYRYLIMRMSFFDNEFL